MKLGIDSYCYHRYFGECYPGLENDPGRRMTVWEFLERARGYRVEGVALETAFLPQPDAGFIARLREHLDGLEVVWAWGHPHGLGSGNAPQAAEDLLSHLEVAGRIGAKVMRICAGGRRTRPRSWREHKAKLVPILRRLIGPAEDHGVVLAIENHIDLLADEMVELITTIDSPWLGVCLDTANNVRMLEEPLAVVAKLAPFARTTHVKDVASQPGDPKEFASWPSVPLGKGLVDIPEVLRLLHGANYSGLLALEIDYLHPAYGGEESAIAESLDFMRACSRMEWR